MALFLIVLFIVITAFLTYYELVLKERGFGRGAGSSFMPKRYLWNRSGGSMNKPKATLAASGNNWGNWKYRLLVELHRRENLKPEEASSIVGVAQGKIEKYLDSLEGEGKVQQIGDAERGIAYKVVNAE